jgi:hypothetical protein
VAGWSASASAQTAQTTPQPGETLRAFGWDLLPVVEGRLRAEYWREVGTKESGILLERARLGFDMSHARFEVRVILQEAGATGAGTDLTGGPARFTLTEPHELWGQWDSPSGNTYLRIGRQPITWGEGRLLGDSDWSITGRTLDAARARIAVDRVALECLGAILSNGNVPDIAPYGELFGALIQAAFDPRLSVEGYVIARLAQDTPVPSVEGTVRGQTYTSALRAYGQTRALRWGLEGAYQWGHADDLGKSRSAWAAASHVAYTFPNASLEPTLRFGGAYAAGGNDASVYRTFDPLLPDVHEWHGAMDLFAWSNVEELSAGAEVKPWPRATLVADYRYVRLAAPDGVWRAEDLTTVGSAPGNRKADLGHEADLSLAWSPDAHLALSVGYSLLALGAGGRAIVTANQLGTSNLSHFGYVQGTLRLP